MLNKIKTVVSVYVIPNLRDVRFLGLIVFGVLIILTSWSAVRIIEVNYSLQKEIAALDAKNQVRALENENLKLKNEYLNTDTYLELTAREQFGKGAKDEKLLLVPKDVALSRAPRLPDETPSVVSKPNKNPVYIQNLKDWRDFYFHKSL